MLSAGLSEQLAGPVGQYTSADQLSGSTTVRAFIRIVWQVSLLLTIKR
jgi:hypothetical protein